MTQPRYLYIMLSETHTGMGRFIRNVSRFRYNHVSLTLDPSLRMWYSFARYHRDAPFYSGFIKEPVERFLAESGDANVRIFRREITPERYRRIEQLFLQAGRPETRLLYNYFDAMASVVNQKIAIGGAYTCLSFACAVLERQFRQIEDLNNALIDELYYEGSLKDLTPDSGARDDTYFTNIGFVRGNLRSLRQLAVVTARLVRHRFGDMVEQKLHSPA